MKLLILIMIIFLSCICPVDSAIRIPLKESDSPSQAPDIDAPQRYIEEIESASTVSDSSIRSDSGRSDRSSSSIAITARTSQAKTLSTSNDLDNEPLKIIKSFYIDNSSVIWVSVEIICIDLISNSSIIIIEALDDNLKIQDVCNCDIIHGNLSDEEIKNLIYYLVRSPKLAQSDFNKSICNGCTWNITKLNNIFYFKINGKLSPNDRIVYTYSFKSPQKNGFHKSITIARPESYREANELLEIDANPRFKVDLLINKYSASFYEEVPIKYEILYTGGSSNPYSISELKLRCCDKINKNQDTYEYHINGMKTECKDNLIDYNNSNFYLYKNNNTRYDMQKKLSILFKPPHGQILPYQTEYELPGIYIDGTYYDTTDRIIVNNLAYRYRDWIIALIVFILTLIFAEREFNYGINIIHKLVENTENSNKEMSYTNKILKNSTIYQPNEEKPRYWSVYVFSWDKIPGMDNDRLREFIAQIFKIDWVKTAEIEKTRKGKAICVYTKKNSLFLVLNSREDKAILIIDDGRIDSFIAATEKDKLNIYWSIVRI